DGFGQTVLLQDARLPPEEQGRHRHDDEDLEEYPDVDTGEDAVEGDDVRVCTRQAHDLVDDGGPQEEERYIARELCPALIAVVKGLAEHEAEKIVLRFEAQPEHQGH